MSEKSGSFKVRTYFYSDLSLWALIFSNVVVMVFALIRGWSLVNLMLVYWCQSISIGVFWFFKLLMLKEFSTKDFTDKNDMPVEPTPETKVKTALFFLAHFGGFHLMYLFFLLAVFKADFSHQILSMAAVFFIYQFFSFLYNKKWITTGKPNIGKMMAFPYARIIPMHFIILAGGFLTALSEGIVIQTVLAVFFITLKIIADVIIHIFEAEGFADKGNSKQIAEEIEKGR